MMGNTHSLSAAAVFLAAAFPVSHYVHHLTPLTAAVGTVVCAGGPSTRVRVTKCKVAVRDGDCVVPALYAGIAAVVFVTHSTWIPALLHTIGAS